MTRPSHPDAMNTPATPEQPAATDPGVLEMQRMRAQIENDSGLPATLGELVHERALATPDALAGHWFDEGLQLSYRELDEAADRLASQLVPLGVRKGSHVAVMLPNVAAFPISWIALGRIGAVMVPVNTGYTGEEMHFVLQDSDAQFLIIDHGYLGAFAAMPARPPLLADERLVVHGGEPPEHAQAWTELVARGTLPFAPPAPVGPDDLAPLFPMELIMQEVSTEREIEIPEPVRDIYRLWRPAPLYRAHRLERCSAPRPRSSTSTKASAPPAATSPTPPSRRPTTTNRPV